MAVNVKERQIVVPGELLADGMDYIPGAWTYRKEEKIFAKKLGIVNISGRAIKIIPLSGKYMPKVGDIIIGKIVDISTMGWTVELSSPYTALLSMKEATTKFIKRGDDLTRYFDVGDYIKAKVSQVTSQNLIDVTMREQGLNKLTNGRIIEINCQKVPRIIGKQGSMISMIKRKANASIVVGQNGLVWIHGDTVEDEIIVEKTIKMIAKNAHLEGLTDRIEKYLDEQSGRKSENKETKKQENNSEGGN